jgi:hypothetical protein
MANPNLTYINMIATVDNYFDLLERCRACAKEAWGEGFESGEIDPDRVLFEFIEKNRLALDAFLKQIKDYR